MNLKHTNLTETTANIQLFEQAKQYIPGGVNSPVRSFNAVGGTPFFTTKAKDAILYDVTGKGYIDYVCSWGANIVGHAREEVIDRIKEVVSNGLSYGTPTVLEIEFAQEIIRLMPNIEKLRLVSSGTEAVMSAIRLARGYTKKDYIVKFIGCYHGHCDALLVKAGSGLATFNHPSSAGVPPAAVEHTLICEYNDIEQLTQIFERYGQNIAGVILEPFAGNMNLVRPTMEFMQAIVTLCQQNNSLLIFDEVMTGFRVALGGAQQLLGVTPDLTILGKVVGGGMPLAAFGGKAHIMEQLAPSGNVYQAGTLSGNPVAITCGLATLSLLQQPGFYEQLNANATQLVQGLSHSAAKYNIPFSCDSIGGMFGFYFSKHRPSNFATVQQANSNLFKKFFHATLAQGIFFAPSMFEAGFICAKHDNKVINTTIAVVDAVFAQLANDEIKDI